MRVNSESRQEFSWFRTLLLAFPMAIAMMAGLSVYMVSLQKSSITFESLQDYGKSPSFVLTNQKGQNISSDLYSGHVWIADFMFTRCAAVCPAMTAQLQKIQGKFPDVKLASFTVDPEYDTPERLLPYSERFKADAESWNFLTGNYGDISLIAAGFHVAGAEEPMFHSNKLILVGPDGVIRGYFDHEDTEDIRRLYRILKSTRNS